jgi:formylglycine-generating enzyme required for sulfatase activity
MHPSQTVNPTQKPAHPLTRRHFLKLGGLSSLGFLAAVAGPNFGGKIAKAQAPQIPQLSSWQFTTVKVNETGEIIQKVCKEVPYFRETLVKGIGIDLIQIPGGSFLMGSPPTELERYDSEGPQHSVTLPDFFLSQSPITQAQWQAVMGNNPSTWQQDNLPVENVSWHDAIEFCHRLGQKTGLRYRLPSEAEWEYACRAKSSTPFYFGEKITAELGNYDEVLTGIPHHQTTPVGSFPANGFGLVDMHGNLWEWCQDLWHNSYEGAPTDGSAWEVGENPEFRILRGGSWHDLPWYSRAAQRFGKEPDSREAIAGFRIAVS